MVSMLGSKFFNTSMYFLFLVKKNLIVYCVLVNVCARVLNYFSVRVYTSIHTYSLRIYIYIFVIHTKRVRNICNYLHKYTYKSFIDKFNKYFLFFFFVILSFYFRTNVNNENNNNNSNKWRELRKYSTIYTIIMIKNHSLKYLAYG